MFPQQPKPVNTRKENNQISNTLRSIALRLPPSFRPFPTQPSALRSIDSRQKQYLSKSVNLFRNPWKDPVVSSPSVPTQLGEILFISNPGRSAIRKASDRRNPTAHDFPVWQGAGRLGPKSLGDLLMVILINLGRFCLKCICGVHVQFAVSEVFHRAHDGVSLGFTSFGSSCRER